MSGAAQLLSPARRARWAGAPALCLALGLTLAGAAASASPTDDPRALLQRMHESAGRSNFQGTLVVTAGNRVSSSRVSFVREGSQQYERIEWMDGEARRAYRHNSQVRTVWPASKTVLVEQRDRLGTFPLLPGPGAADFRVEDHYELRMLPPERVAGHLAVGLWLKPRDGSRFGQRLWADKGSGVLLRADILDPDDQVLETMAFSDIAIGQRQRVELAPEPGPGWRVITPVVNRTELAAEGWTMTSMVPGFRGVGCKRRTMGAANAGTPSLPVVQAVFSDGVTHVSLFIEPLHPRAQTRPGGSQYGATHTLMRDRHGHWITAVGDVPYATLDRFIAALERRP